jgi:hypothetical protein
MRDLLVDSARRRRMPVWVVSRLYLRPDRSYCSRPVGKWRAWSKDQAIEKAARAIKRLALLTAEPEPPYFFEPEKEVPGMSDGE